MTGVQTCALSDLLQRALGDALHALSCAAGYNIRWLMRAIIRLGQKVAFLRLLLAAFVPALQVNPSVGIRLAALAQSLAARMAWPARPPLVASV